MRWNTLQKERGQEVLEFTNTFHTLHTKMGIKECEQHLVLTYRGVYTDTSKLKWIFWISHHLVLHIDMLLKSSRNLGTKKNGSSDLQIYNNPSIRKTTLTNIFHKTSLSHGKRRVTRRKRRTSKNGAISTKSLGTTPMNVAQNSHWRPRLKTRSRTLIQNPILKILVKDRSSMKTPLLLSRPQQFNQKNQ
jgi:hypothetical protein